jgi:UDP-N-acetylglucosamine enolpyruvyl transferase
MSSFRIKGGHKLKGEIIPQGAKNEALQVICAPLLTAEPVTIHNIPDILDVNKLIDLLSDLGCVVEKLGKDHTDLQQLPSIRLSQNCCLSTERRQRFADQ